MEPKEEAAGSKPTRSPLLYNRAAVRALVLAEAERAFGPGRVTGVRAGVYKDVQVAIVAAVRRCVEQHRRGSKQVDGAVVMDVAALNRRRRRP